MPRTIRFHLDESCATAIAQGLKNLGIDATTTPEAGLLSAPDEEQLAFSAREGRVIFTHDRDLLRVHARGTRHAGIAYCKKDALGIGQIIAGLVLIWEVYDADEIVNRIEYL
jgi:hypothetical protein